MAFRKSADGIAKKGKTEGKNLGDSGPTSGMMHGGKGKGKGSPRDWKLVLDVYGFKNEMEALDYKFNPIDNLKPLADAKVPLLHVFGDADDVVPWEENTGLIEERYKKIGGDITLIRKKGIGHHPHGLDDPAPIVDFIVKNSLSKK